MKRLCASDKESEPRRLRGTSEPPNSEAASAAAPPEVPSEVDGEHRPFARVSGPEYEHRFLKKKIWPPQDSLSYHDDHLLSAVPGQNTIVMVEDSPYDVCQRFTLRVSNKLDQTKQIKTAFDSRSWPPWNHVMLGAQAFLDADGELCVEVALSTIADKGERHVYMSQYKGTCIVAHRKLIYRMEGTAFCYKSRTGRLALVIVDHGGIMRISVPEAPAFDSPADSLKRVDYELHYNPCKKGLPQPELKFTTFSACAGPEGSGLIYTLAHAVDPHGSKFITIIGHNESDGRIASFTSSPLDKWQTDVDGIRMGWHLMQIASDGRLIVVYSVAWRQSIYAMSITGVSSDKPVLVRSELKVDDSIAWFRSRWEAILLPGDVIGVLNNRGEVVCFK